MKSYVGNKIMKKNKILVINHMREPSGWGQAARDYVQAMNKVGLDIVVRSIRPNNNLPEYPLSDELKQLEQKKLEGCNIVIQHLLPHLMDYDGRFDKNIGFSITETDNWWHSGWHDYLNLMDEIWVPNFYAKTEARTNKLVKPVHVVPHAKNIEKYNKKYTKLDIPHTQGHYKFYFIGEFNRRKRISAMIQAYFLNFTKNDPVSLILKVQKWGLEPQQIYQELQKIVDEIKHSHKLYHGQDNYPHIVIIPNFMSDEDIYSLHSTCDCFVTSSFGEAWQIPAFDAVGFNKQVIAPHYGGPVDFLRHYGGGYLIEGVRSPVFGMNETFNQLNTAKEDWFNVDIRSMSNTMRYIYDTKQQSTDGTAIVKNFSYENIGNRIKELL